MQHFLLPILSESGCSVTLNFGHCCRFFIIYCDICLPTLLLARLMGQYGMERCRLSASSVVCRRLKRAWVVGRRRAGRVASPAADTHTARRDSRVTSR